MFLLVNPYIYDFAAYDMWMMPLGLLHLGYNLKKRGYEVKLIDLLSVDYDKHAFGIKRKSTGDGKLPAEVVEKPEALKNIPKKYKRYGIPEEKFIGELEKLQEKPEAIFVTSKMTYWYPGIAETIGILKSRYPDTKVILGGTYAKLLPDHARKASGADIVIKDEFYSQYEEDVYSMDLSLLPGVRFLPLLSTTGCPFDCTYCSSKKLFPVFRTFSPERTIEQLLVYAEQYNLHDVTIFDDAFLVNRGHAKRVLKLLIQSGKKFRIHTPNALHARYIDSEISELIRTAGFYTIHLGLESNDLKFQRVSGGKVFNQEFLSAVENLHRAGYKPGEIGVYVMCGLPFQKKEDVINTINFVIASGARPKLVEYSPVPGTPLFEVARHCSPFNLDEPIFHNNSLLPCQWSEFTWEDLEEIKEILKKAVSMI